MPLEGIAQPNTITTGIALLLIGFYSITGIIAFRLYSPVSLFVWAIGILAMVFSIVLQTSFMYVWLVLGILVLVESFSMTVFIAGYGNI